MSCSASWSMKMNASETLETGVDAATTPTIRHDGFDGSGTINASSAVPATKCAFDEIALVAGAKTIDLTNLTGTNGATVDLTGLKVQLLKFTNTGTNTMLFAQGGSNPYNLAGGTWSMRLLANQSFMFYGADAAADVASGAKNIDVTGTGTETFEFSVVAG